ncbi:hypothetical protein [Limnobacter parvus]|uniref:Peptidase MA-like domain-containing protein n=1 Tax=Limnobacter parvus TaxID=2939690 RepID=A0ABT1XKV5_9BURK|nr:hypothetical protein [Limnobacter parvus]MCR2747928.1 hypothetical protein [Limnobacter parvus]
MHALKIIPCSAIFTRLICLAFSCLPLSALALTPVQACPNLPIELAHEYRVDGFLLQFDTEGKHALLNQDDSNNNQIPDLLEDVATQLQTMKRLMAHFGFVDPLSQPRYQSQQARAVQVRFLSMSGNGLAFDEVRQNSHGECVLLINLSSKLGPRNLTPAHEWFHLVQYGYTPFKRSWFLEGMARWSESALRKEASMPNFGSSLAGTELFAQSYNAQAYWFKLASQSSEPSQHDFPESISGSRYLNGDPVLQDKVLHGPHRMRRALEALAILGANESKRRDLDPHHWPEAIQRLPEHDLKMKIAVESTALK